MKHVTPLPMNGMKGNMKKLFSVASLAYILVGLGCAIYVAFGADAATNKIVSRETYFGSNELTIIPRGAANQDSFHRIAVEDIKSKDSKVNERCTYINSNRYSLSCYPLN